MKKLTLAILIIVVACPGMQAQDTLPKFNLVNAGGNRIIVSWTNTFTSIRQLSIQRSFDSLTGFKTILTVPDPTTPQNGYVDAKAVNDHMFYRLYVMLEKGVFMFSDAKKPFVDSSLKYSSIASNRLDKIGGIESGNPGNEINNGNKPYLFKPSNHVYTYKDGYVRINLPDDEDKKYHIKFFEEDDTFLFELKDIKSRTFKIDKTNFYHAGWFKFELYENDKLIEKYKFYLEKDF
jgi:hypothetical protein